MFNYIKDAVINDTKQFILRDTDGKAVDKTFTAAAGDELVLKRVGNYKVAGIKNVVLTKGTCGKIAQYVFTPDYDGVGADDLIHVEFAIKMDGKYLGEYANANWAKFGKKIIVEFTKSADIKVIQSQFDMAVADIKSPFDEDVKLCKIDVAAGAATFTVSLSDPYLSISVPTKEDTDGKIKFDKTADVPGVFVGYLDSDCALDCELKDFKECKVTAVVNAVDACDPTAEFEEVEEVKDLEKPFATGEWLMENLRVPTYYNRRFGAVGEKNYPIAGQVYDQIAFEYVMDRPGLGGLSAVNQKIQSATTHVIYIPQTDPAATYGLTAGEAMAEVKSVTIKATGEIEFESA